MLFLLTICISDCLCLAHIVEIRISSLSVLFWDRSSSSYFSRKLVEFWAHANSLDHLDWSHSVLVVFNFLYSEKKKSLPPIKAVVRTSDCLSLAHTVEIRMNSLSVFFRDGNSSSYFSRKLFEFWAYANSLDHLDCSHGALAVFSNNFLFQKQMPPLSRAVLI